MKKLILFSMLWLIVSGCSVKCIGEPEAMINKKYPMNKIIRYTVVVENGLYDYHYDVLTEKDVERIAFLCKGKFSDCVETER